MLPTCEYLNSYKITVINGAKYNAHTEPLFKELCILPVDKLIEFFNLQFMQNFIQGFLPISFNNVWITNMKTEDQRIIIMS